MKEKRRVCITTFYGTENYGSNLQAIGLSKTIEKLGFDVSFCNRFKVMPFTLSHPIMLYARLINKLNKKKYNAFFNPTPYKKTDRRLKRLQTFKDQNFKTEIIDSPLIWKQHIEKKTIFAAGSDIIWNPARGYPTVPFLDFAYYADLPRFSYGSSIGALELPRKYYRAYRRYLGSMIEVGVREQSVADMLEGIIHRNVTKVIDPSLLLSRDEWDDYALKAKVSVPIIEKGFVLCYFVMNDPRYWQYVERIKANTGKQIIVLPMHELDEHQPYDIVLDGTPYEFIWLIKNAEFICTDSFHTCAISLIYQKEFYLLRRTRKAENAKYDDFLNHYHLETRSVSDERHFERQPKINYEMAQAQLELDRQNSLEFLETVLQRCENYW